MSKSTHYLPAVLTPAPVLITESAEDFNRFFDALKNELKQRRIVDRLLIKNIGEGAWEIRRYRYAKVSCINSAILPALKNLLRPIIQKQVAERQGRIRKPLELHLPTQEELQRECDANLEASSEVNRLADQWFVDEDTKESILKMFADNKLDEYAIETEAMRIAAPELKMFDRLEESGERRLHKTLRLLGDYRSGLGRQAVERVVEREVLAIANKAKKPPPAAA